MDARGGQSLPVADLDRRFYAQVVDQLLGALAIAAGIALAAPLDGWPMRLLVMLLVVAAVLTAYAVALGTTGSTPGKAALGLRALDERDGTPIGVGNALVRSVVVALAGLPTLGFGLATLAMTAVVDPEHRRRGWHDRLVGSVVYDVRPPRAEAEPREPERPRAMVNLTAARLLPGADAHTSTSRPAPPVAPDRTALRSSRPPVHWRLTLDTGESVVVEGLALLGRAPAPRPGEDVRHLLPLTSRDMSISKTHAAIAVVDGALVVTDRGSTNGSVLLRQGVPRDLRDGRPTTLLDGDRVRLGDRELTVSREA